jgi:hypothetical protein
MYMSRFGIVPGLMLLVCTLTLGEDWPSWRGPRGDGSWEAPKLPDKWPAEGLKTVWKKTLGGGYAGITVVKGNVYTMDYDAQAKEERVLCLNGDSGEIRWSHKYSVDYASQKDLTGYGNGPRVAPTFHDGKIYTLGAVGHLFCLDAMKGDIVWSHDLVKDFKAKVPMWGYAASPVIDEDRLLVQAGAEQKGCLIAFDRRNGKEIWRSVADPAGYAIPLVIHPKSGKQIVLWTPVNIHGLNASDGKVLWSFPYEVTYGVSIATPIYQEGIIFISAYWHGSKAVRLGEKPTDAEIIWEDSKLLRGLMAQPLYREGHVYTIDRDYGLTCFELKTGKKLWDDENKMTPRARNPHASFVWIKDSDRILSLNSVGDLILAQLSPKGYKELSRTKVVDGRIWGHPGYSGDRMFIKTDGAESWRKATTELSCISLTKPSRKQEENKGNRP